MTRQIVLDTETTGIEVEQGHRIIEIGCVELHDRCLTGNDFHHYLNPERSIDAGAAQVHGIDDRQLQDKPRFREIADQLLDYLRGAELIIHNAAFDVGFLDAELAGAGRSERLAAICSVTDTLQLARRMHPGSRASLDALCKRYAIDNSNRELHGALVDARLLADVYLAMTGGQSTLRLESHDADTESVGLGLVRAALGTAANQPLRILRADTEECARHRDKIASIGAKAGRHFWPTPS